jgi:hypothetical protein
VSDEAMYDHLDLDSSVGKYICNNEKNI